MEDHRLSTAMYLSLWDVVFHENTLIPNFSLIDVYSAFVSCQS